MTVTNANAMSAGISAIALAGGALTLAAINTALSVVVANTDLDGTAATSDSFGTVREVLRILSGETYRLPALTILGAPSTTTSDFLGRAARQAIVDAQLASDVVTYGQFYAAGDFLAAGTAGYRARPTLVPTGAFNISNTAGVIAGYKLATFAMLHNNDYAYAAADVLAWRPRAFLLGTGNVPATGIARAIRAYNQDGTAL